MTIVFDIPVPSNRIFHNILRHSNLHLQQQLSTIPYSANSSRNWFLFGDNGPLVEGPLCKVYSAFVTSSHKCTEALVVSIVMSFAIVYKLALVLKPLVVPILFEM